STHSRSLHDALPISTRDRAKQENFAIAATKGNVAELRKQAKGHSSGAEAARRYLRQIESNEKIIRESTDALRENTVAIGENVQRSEEHTSELQSREK